MNKTLILSVIVCCLLTGEAFAQSGAKKAGSSSRSYGSSSRPTRADREMATAKAKLVRQMTREDFEGVKLNRDQKKFLTSMVDAKYSQMVQLDNQIAGSIPAEKVKDLQKAYRSATRGGSSEVEAMSMSMQKIGLSEMVQEKVLMMNKSKDDIRAAIQMSIVKMFDQEQQAIYTASMASKKEMMDKEEKKDEDMADDKKMAGEEEMTDDKEMTGEKEMAGEKLTVTN